MRSTRHTVEWAIEQVDTLLVDLPRRRAHLLAVGRASERIAHIVAPVEREALMTAAYLHDIGYAPALSHTGIHQLDGAAWLRDLGHERVACLVAHHSESRFEIGLRGRATALATYEREESPVRDALVYCDMVVGPSGERMTVNDRLDEVEGRYGEGLILDALRRSRPHLEAAVARTAARLAESETHVGQPR